MKILIAVEVWSPFVSGVVRTFSATVEHLRQMGHEVKVLHPYLFHTFECPTNPGMRLALTTPGRVSKMIDEFDPDAIHIALEGPLGMWVRLHCARRKIPFTTSFTTKLAEQIRSRVPVPLALTYAWLKWFHAKATRCMVAVDTLEQELTERGFRNLCRWSRGVDTNLFRPVGKDRIQDERPISMYVGRVAPEKNIEAFLEAEAPGTKYVVGFGPQVESLQRRYPHVRFVGEQKGQDLVDYYSAADVFVFPSKTDTFGLVLLEALACGVPVAAYPVTGPLDVLGGSDVAVLDDDIGKAIRGALEISPEACRKFACERTWRKVTQQFEANLAPIHPPLEVPLRKAA